MSKTKRPKFNYSFMNVCRSSIEYEKINEIRQKGNRITIKLGSNEKAFNDCFEKEDVDKLLKF